jgi:hypothetical protein
MRDLDKKTPIARRPYLWISERTNTLLIVTTLGWVIPALQVLLSTL